MRSTQIYMWCSNLMCPPSLTPALAQHALNMVLPSKKSHASCLTLLSDLTHMVGQVLVGLQAPRSPGPVPISMGLVARMLGLLFVKSEGSSPEGTGLLSYFQVPRQRVSRWKEDWGELEILVSHFTFPVQFPDALLVM